MIKKLFAASLVALLVLACLFVLWIAAMAVMPRAEFPAPEQGPHEFPPRDCSVRLDPPSKTGLEQRYLATDPQILVTELTSDLSSPSALRTWFALREYRKAQTRLAETKLVVRPLALTNTELDGMTYLGWATRSSDLGGITGVERVFRDANSHTWHLTDFDFAAIGACPPYFTRKNLISLDGHEAGLSLLRGLWGTQSWSLGWTTKTKSLELTSNVAVKDEQEMKRRLLKIAEQLTANEKAGLYLNRQQLDATLAARQ